MNLLAMDRKLKIRKFYEQEYLKFREPDGWDEIITDFKYNKQIAGTAYNLYEDMTKEELQKADNLLYKRESPSPLSVTVNQKETVPNSISEACDRLNWYLKHSLGELSVIKIPVDNIPTFAFLIQGYAGDGWDNSCELIEIWDNSGELIGFVYPPSIDDEEKIWNWKDRPIRSNDFNTPPPKW